MTTISGHTTRAAGTILTASIYNADHLNHIANAIALNATKLEGAVGPVVDGHAAVFSGVSGSVLRSAGLAPADINRQIIAGTGLTGGGSLTADRTLSPDFSDQATAEAGSSNVKVMTPLRVAQQTTFRQASLAEAQAGTDNTKLMTPLRVRDQSLQFLASLAEAQAGVDNTKFMTPLRTANAIAALAQTVNLGAATTGFTSGSPWNTLVDGDNSAVFLVTYGNANLQLSSNGGTNFVTIATGDTSNGSIIFVKADISVILAIQYDSGGASMNPNVARTVHTAGAGNWTFRMSSGSGTGIRVM